MSSSVCLASVIIVLLCDIIIAQQNNDTIAVRHCYGCVEHENSTSCDAKVECPPTQPYCATVATSPSFTSSLRCVEASEVSCSLLYSASERSHRITCICATELCNQPFPEQFARELKEFSAHQVQAVANATDVTDLFLRKSLPYVNVSRNDLFNKIFNVTIKKTDVNTIIKLVLSNASEIIDDAVNGSKSDAPRAEALKQEVISAPSDDEEDGEGSGAWGEDGRSPRRPSPAAAAPSSFLPAHENKGSPLFINLLVTMPFVLYVTIK